MEMNHKAISNYIALVLIFVMAISLGAIINMFARHSISTLTKSAEKGTEFHDYSIKQCALFYPSVVKAEVRSSGGDLSNLSRISSTEGKERITYNGNIITKIASNILTVWGASNYSWYSIYNIYGKVIKSQTKLTQNSFVPFSGKWGNKYIVIDIFYNGSNYEYNLSVINTTGKILFSKRLTYDEEDELFGDIATDPTHIAIAYVYGRNRSYDIKLMILDSSFNIIKNLNVSTKETMEYNPSIAYFNGVFYIAYENYEYGNATIQLAKYSNGIVTHLGNVSNYSGGMYLPSLAASDKHLLLAYTQVYPNGDEKIKYIIYNKSFYKIKDNEIAYPSGGLQENPSTIYKNGIFTISWNEKDTSSNSFIRGIEIRDSDLSIIKNFIVTYPQHAYGNDIELMEENNNAPIILIAGKQNSLWDLFLKLLINTKKLHVLISNPSNLNVTITDMKVFFKDGTYCKLEGDPFLRPMSTQLYIGKDCDPSKSCEDIEKIRVGTECGIRELKPKC